MIRLAAGLALLSQLAQLPATPAKPDEQLAQAEARYRAAIELNPSVAAYHQSLARVLERQGRLAEALTEHRRSATLDSLSARNREGYGSILLRSGKADEAVTELRAAARLDPSSIDVRKQLATALMTLGQKQEAASVLRETRNLAPEDSSVARMLAAAASASEAQRTGYHDYSDFEGDHSAGRIARTVLRSIFAIVLGIAALALVAPLAGTALLVLVRLPYERFRGYAAARVSAH